MWSRNDEPQQWYNDPRTVRKMMDEVSPAAAGGRCTTCHVPFDKGKRRRITDDCGHERCYYCMLNADGPGCPICAAEAAKAPLSNPSRPRMKTNGHFTAFMQTRNPHTRGPSAPGVASPKISHISWRDRKATRPSTVSVDNYNALSDDEFSQPVYQQPPPSEHLYTRLGLLLGQRWQPGCRGGSQGSFASVSSLENSDVNMASSTNTSPISTLTGSSEAEAMSVLGGASSREESSDSVASLMSTSSSPSPSRRAAPFQQRNNSVPCSSRRRGGPAPLLCSAKPQTLAQAGAQPHYQASLQPALKPLFFQVPQPDQDPPFIGRQWLFDEIDQECQKDNSRGVVIVGCPGSGKTAAILQLVESSAFGPRREDLACRAATPPPCAGPAGGSWSQLSVPTPGDPDSRGGVVGRLGAQLVAYHFCQADNSATCLVPDFVHSVAAQLCQAPQLVAYRHLLLRDAR